LSFTTVYIFRLQGWRNRFWAFRQMRDAHKSLKTIAGQSFYKLMGSGGGNGFSLWPDWGTYVLLQNWQTEEAFAQFKENSSFFKTYCSKATQLSFLKLKVFKTQGTWNGQEPFQMSKEKLESKHMAVLTRASIKPSLLHKFWRYVPGVSKKIFDFDGLILAKGVGEIPFMEQATISLWNSQEVMKSFAYKNPKHARVVKKTRQLDWYSEELFARFHVLEMSGNYDQVNFESLSE
jgi:heme-degrading monooxygenase HmoA